MPPDAKVSAPGAVAGAEAVSTQKKLDSESALRNNQQMGRECALQQECDGDITNWRLSA
jgi:hypothetical protein